MPIMEVRSGRTWFSSSIAIASPEICSQRVRTPSRRRGMFEKPDSRARFLIRGFATISLPFRYHFATLLSPRALPYLPKHGAISSLVGRSQVKSGRRVPGSPGSLASWLPGFLASSRSLDNIDIQHIMTGVRQSDLPKAGKGGVRDSMDWGF